MERRNFLQTLSTIGMSTLTLQSLAQQLTEKTEEMPILFIGHGSPMNAIEKNEFSNTWTALGKELPRPSLILCISAHWETVGTKILGVEKPETIHDFGGFPPALHAAQYPAPGNVQFAKEIADLDPEKKWMLDETWGLDHGAWSILMPMFPKHDIPVVQLSLDVRLTPQKHFELASLLQPLRKKGVLIVGSGNIVHNLGRLNFNGQSYDWALEFDHKVVDAIEKRNFKTLIEYPAMGASARLSVPSAEHYLPLLYITALAHSKDPLHWFNQKITMGSVSMTSFQMG